MKSKKLLTFFICVCALNAQAQFYNFTATSATYTNLTGSTSLNGTATWDDPNFTIPIGFGFQYFNNSLSTFYISDVGLGADLVNTPNDFGVVSILQAYGADIIDRGFDVNVGESSTGSQSNISYKLEGSSGNRILKVEWNNVGFYGDVDLNGASATNFTNFQLWLFESDNSIEIHFGPNSITDTNLAFDDLSGSSIILVEEFNLDSGILGPNGALLLTGSPVSPSLVTVFNFNNPENNVLNGVIPNGTLYRFVPSNLSTDEFETAQLKLFPNPSKDVIHINGLTQTQPYKIYNVMGSKMMEGDVNSGSSINIESLADGLYLIEFGTTTTLKFMKR